MKLKSMDARKLNYRMLTELRKRGVASVQEGTRPEGVGVALGVSRGTVYSWLAHFRSGGYGALDARTRGGRKPKLDGSAIRMGVPNLTEKNPLQPKFPFALWTANMVGQLTFERFGVKMSKSSVCRLLSQWGLIPQRLVWRASEKRSEEVQRWLQQQYPQDRRMAKKHNALIFFGDEAGVRSGHPAGTPPSGWCKARRRWEAAQD